VSARGRAALAAFVTAVTWGMGAIVVKVTLREMGPLTLGLARSLVGGMALLAYVRSVLSPSTMLRTGSSKGWLALRGLLGVTLFTALWYGGLAHTTATNVSLIGASTPAVTAVLSIPLLKERPSPVQVGGIVVAVVGTLLVVFSSGHARLAGSFLLGDLLAFAGVISWSLYTIIGRSHSARNLDPMALTGYDLLFGALFLVPLAAYETAGQGIAPLSLTLVSLVLLIGLWITAGGFVLWNYALTAMTASEVATYLNLSPVATLIGARLLLGEAIQWEQIGGAALTLVGVYMVTRGHRT
jgi:drug/metabolite transporter (DMT)-like permease